MSSGSGKAPRWVIWTPVAIAVGVTCGAVLGVVLGAGGVWLSLGLALGVTGGVLFAEYNLAGRDGEAAEPSRESEALSVREGWEWEDDSEGTGRGVVAPQALSEAPAAPVARPAAQRQARKPKTAGASKAESGEAPKPVRKRTPRQGPASSEVDTDIIM